MDIDNVDCVTYSEEHITVVKSGITTIKDFINNKDSKEIRSLLFCLDKYLDPYYGYNLPYFDDIILLLQELLFQNDILEVKQDILQLLRDYTKGTLDYLAGRIEELEKEPQLLSDALYALGLTFNGIYIPIIIRYENHHDSFIRNSVEDILRFLKEANVQVPSE